MNKFINKMRDISTFGNKKLGSIMSKDLLSLSLIIPNIQRIIDIDKVNDIVVYQKNELKERGVCNFFGLINIHFCYETKEYYLVDGQHRYEAIKILSKYNNIPFAIEVVDVSSLDELKQNYLIINKNTPLPEFPDTIDKNIPETVAKYFKTKYPSIWSKTSRARRPHIYFNYFQEALGFLSEQLKIKDADILQKVVVDYNERIMNWDVTGLPDYKNINEQLLTKCNETGIYLGLYKHISDEYRYEWVRDIIKEQTGVTITKTKPVTKTNTKTSIPKTLKTSIWNMYVGTKHRTAYCICCNDKTIAVENFHAGHIISEHNNGKTNTDNLLPICSQCNLSMGKTNMNEFIEKTYPNNMKIFNSRKCKIPHAGFIKNLFN